MKIMLFIASLFSFNLLADKQADLIALIKANQNDPYALCNKGGTWGFGKKTLRSSSGDICFDKVVAAFSLYLCVDPPKDKKVEGFYFPGQVLKKQSDCFKNAMTILPRTDFKNLKHEEMKEILNRQLPGLEKPIQQGLCAFIKKHSEIDYKYFESFCIYIL